MKGEIDPTSGWGGVAKNLRPFLNGLGIQIYLFFPYKKLINSQNFVWNHYQQKYHFIYLFFNILKIFIKEMILIIFSLSISSLPPPPYPLVIMILLSMSIPHFNWSVCNMLPLNTMFVI